jgi:class 3 adenylate cyclase/tetratricopeptide (TPR) repeat protein
VAELPSGTVTFLFTDIEGSTRVLERLRDHYADVLEDHHRLLREVFARHGGHEVDTQGDAFFIAFQRAKDAVAAAVAAQRALLAQRWPQGIDVRVRFGLHTGEPVLGTNRYIGLGIHRAARISSVGYGSQILVSSATRELIADDLPADAALVDLGEFRLKDLERPERIYQLTVEGLPDRFPPLKAQKLAATTVFVGREGELAQLVLSLEDAVAGRGCVVLLGGEPGIGKSRLADELAGRARERGARVLWGRCWEGGGAPAYWPWVQSIRSYVREADPDGLRKDMGPRAYDMAQMLPELRDLFPDLPRPVSTDPEGARFRLFDSTAAFLRSVANRRPLVLVLDDLHAADAPSLLLLQFVVGELTHARTLIIGSYRDIELGREHPLRATLAELSRAPATRTLTLRGLGGPDVALFIEQITGHSVRDSVVAAIHAETEGNPLFVGEVVRLLASERNLDDVGEGAAWRTTLPDSVREVIRRRLRRLSDECTRVLTLASLIGRDFSLDVLGRLSELSGDHLLQALDDAMSARVVTEVPGSLGRLRFSHALIREVLYEEITPLRRARLHVLSGQILEEVYAHDPEPHLAELAHHFFRGALALAGESAKAIEYARRAAARAVALTAYEEAVRLYRMALELVGLREPADDKLRCELLLGLGDARARAGEIATARDTFLGAAEAARRLRLPEQLARAALGYGGRFVWEAARGDPHLVQLLEEALTELPRIDSPLRAQLLVRLAGGPLRDEVNRERRDVLSREAVEIARRLGDLATLAYVLDGRYSAVWWPNNLEERLEVSSELVRAATEGGDKERALQGHHYRALALLEAGDLPSVYAELDAKAKLVDELRQPVQRWYLASVGATLATFEGRFDEAEELIGQAATLGERAEGSMAAVYRVIHLHALRSAQGRLAEHEELVRRAAAEFPTYVVLRCVLAHTSAELGNESEARALLDSLAADDFTALPENEEWLFGMCLLADVAHILGDAHRAAALYRLLLPYSALNAVSAPDSCLGSISRNLGVLAATLTRWDEARRHFENALAMNTRTGGRPWVAQTQYNYARMLLASEPSDRQRAMELTSGCLELARKLGMAELLRKASALQQRLDILGKPRAAGP